jgi:hypothetical protein
VDTLDRRARAIFQVRNIRICFHELPDLVGMPGTEWVMARQHWFLLSTVPRLLTSIDGT